VELGQGDELHGCLSLVLASKAASELVRATLRGQDIGGSRPSSPTATVTR